MLTVRLELLLWGVKGMKDNLKQPTEARLMDLPADERLIDALVALLGESAEVSLANLAGSYESRGAEHLTDVLKSGNDLGRKSPEPEDQEA